MIRKHRGKNSITSYEKVYMILTNSNKLITTMKYELYNYEVYWLCQTYTLFLNLMLSFVVPKAFDACSRNLQFNSMVCILPARLSKSEEGSSAAIAGGKLSVDSKESRSSWINFCSILDQNKETNELVSYI